MTRRPLHALPPIDVQVVREALLDDDSQGLAQRFRASLVVRVSPHAVSVIGSEIGTRDRKSRMA